MIIQQHYPIKKFTEYSFQTEDRICNQPKTISVGFSNKTQASNAVKTLTIDNSLFNNTSKQHEIDLNSIQIIDFFTKGINIIFSLPNKDNSNNDQKILADRNLKTYRKLSTSISAKSLDISNHRSNSAINLLFDSFNLIYSNICHFAVYISKDNLQTASSVHDISDVYLKCRSKMNAVTSAFSPLCISKYNLNFDFDEIFKQAIIEIFSSNKVTIKIQSNSIQTDFLDSKEEQTKLKVSEFFDGKLLYRRISTMIIQFFIENILQKSFFVSSEDDDFNLHNSEVGYALQFMKDTGHLFETEFIPLFIDSIISEYTPIINQIFERHQTSNYNGEVLLNLKEYFEDIDGIQRELNESIKRISFVLSDSTISDIKISFQNLFFASKLDQICKSGLRNLIYNKDIETIEKCAELARLTDKINKFAHELSFDLESTVSNCFKESPQNNPVRESIGYMNLLNQLIEKSFAKHDRMLKEAFRKGFNVMPDLAARLTAEEVNYVFLHLEIYTTINKTASENEYFGNMKFMDNLMNLFKFLNRTDVFEVYHHLLLSHRVLMLKTSTLYADEMFAKWLREFCGVDYTQRIDTIFVDLHKSSKLIRQFNEENLKKNNPTPNFFNALVLSQSSWIADKLNFDDSKIKVPDSISPLLIQFSAFYLANNPNKRFVWSHYLSRVKLQINPNNQNSAIKEIQCNGRIATIFCLFNHSKYLKKSEIIEKLNGDEFIISEYLKIMKSKKTGKLLRQNKSKDLYYLDLESAYALKIMDSNGTLSFPLLKMHAPKNEVVSTATTIIDQNCSQQIDAAIIRFLKFDHTMEKDVLKEKVRDQINFRLDDEMYEKELRNLSNRFYIRIDQAEKVHYLP